MLDSRLWKTLVAFVALVALMTSSHGVTGAYRAQASRMVRSVERAPHQLTNRAIPHGVILDPPKAVPVAAPVQTWAERAAAARAAAIAARKAAGEARSRAIAIRVAAMGDVCREADAWMAQHGEWLKAWVVDLATARLAEPVCVMNPELPFGPCTELDAESMEAMETLLWEADIPHESCGPDVYQGYRMN